MLDKYSPAEIESKHYQNWEEQGYFQPDMDLTKPSFSIQLPPPNVTGTLHMGHAFNQTIMDGLTRYYRMKGCNTAWIPTPTTRASPRKSWSSVSLPRKTCPVMTWVVKNSWKKCGNGKKFPAARLRSRCAVWAVLPTGRASISQWTMYAPKP